MQDCNHNLIKSNYFCFESWMKQKTKNQALQKQQIQMKTHSKMGKNYELISYKLVTVTAEIEFF